MEEVAEQLQLAVPSGMRLKEAVALEKCLKRSEVRSILDPQDVSHFAVEADEEEGKALRDDEMRVAVVGEVVVDQMMQWVVSVKQSKKQSKKN